MTYPNGMVKEWGYDARDRLTSLVYRDAPLGNVLASYEYELDDLFNVLKMTEADGTYWDYGYDDRYRLTSAVRNNKPTPTIKAKYAYTYDASDNMLTKVEPFEDDFNDTNITGWVVLNGTWSASSNALIKTDNGWGNVAVLSDDADNEIRLDYRFTDISGADMGQVVPRFLSGNDNLAILIAPGAIILYSTVSGTATTLDYQTFSTVEDQWYTLRVESDGANVKVWRSTEGELETEVLSTTSAAPTTTDAVLMGIVNTTMSNSPFELDNIRILADDLDNDFTFTYNNGNELTSMAGPNGTTTFTYDDWGRQATQTLNSVTDIYAYRYGSKLYSVDLATDSNIDVTFDYGGDQKRRSTTAGGVTTGFNWDMFWSVINEETAGGGLARTYFAGQAHVAGATPAAGDYNHYLVDHLGSTRGLYDQNKSLIASYDYSPYGNVASDMHVSDTTQRYSGHDLNVQLGLYFAPYRFYSPHSARWLTRDPLGFADGPNMYGYVHGNPISNIDPDGRGCTCVTLWDGDKLVYKKCWETKKDCHDSCDTIRKYVMKACKKIKEPGARGICQASAKSTHEGCYAKCGEK